MEFKAAFFLFLRVLIAQFLQVAVKHAMWVQGHAPSLMCTGMLLLVL